MRMTVAYYRSSLEQQENSVPMQRDKARLYAQKHGMAIQEHYDDEGKSARKNTEIGRPAMHQLRQDIRAHLIGTILVYKRDRLARRAREYMEFYRLCRKFDVKIIFTAENEHPVFYTPLGEFIELIFAGIIEREADQIVERLRGTQITNFINKKAVGNLPYGLIAVEGRQDKGEIRFWSNEVKEEIKAIYEEFLQWSTTRGNQTFSAFVKLQNERHPRRTHRKCEEEGVEGGGVEEQSAEWTDGNLRGLLTNALYMGKHRKTWGDQMYEVDRPECAILSPKDWEATHKAMEPFLTVHHEIKKRDYLLEGLATCARCTSLLEGKTYQRKHGHADWYLCVSKNCAVRIPARECENEIYDRVLAFLTLLLKENGDALYRSVMADERKRIKEKMSALREEQAHLQTRFMGLVSRYVKDGVSSPDLFFMKKNLDESYRAIQGLEADLRQLQALPLGTMRRKIRIQDLQTELKQGAIMRQRELLADLLSEIQIDKNAIAKLVFRHPFQKVVSHVSS